MSDLPKPPTLEVVGPEFAATTLGQLVLRTIAGYLHDVGNAIEVNFSYRLEGKDYVVHMHLCVREADAAPKTAVKH